MYIGYRTVGPVAIQWLIIGMAAGLLRTLVTCNGCAQKCNQSKGLAQPESRATAEVAIQPNELANNMQHTSGAQLQRDGRGAHSSVRKGMLGLKHNHIVLSKHGSQT